MTLTEGIFTVNSKSIVDKRWTWSTQQKKNLYQKIFFHLQKRFFILTQK